MWGLSSSEFLSSENPKVDAGASASVVGRVVFRWRWQGLGLVTVSRESTVDACRLPAWSFVALFLAKRGWLLSLTLQSFISPSGNPRVEAGRFGVRPRPILVSRWGSATDFTWLTAV